MFSHVLVGWDETAIADRAVDVAAEVARRFDARLAIVDVVQPVPHGGPDERERQAELRGHRLHGEEAVARAARHGVTASFALIEDGDAAHALVDAAHRIGADLIVVGRRHSGSLERKLLGSVSDTVLRLAQTPVLVVSDELRG
ncbi:MAG TPA: universal stress protein [Candidatus Sulfotelmatobacter sp.]|nr:universal stress protein [Candidatus Sulfotelmatobacter sp.]